MLAGLVTAIIGIFFTFLQGAFFTAGLLLIISTVICFGSYYVSRYAELKEMEEQLLSLKATNRLLTGSVETLKKQIDELDITKASLERSATELEGTLDSLKKSQPNLFAALEQLHRITPVLEANEKRVNELLVQQATLSGSLTSETERLNLVRQDIELEVRQLHEIRIAIEAEVEKLKRVTPAAPNQFNAETSTRDLFHHNTIAQNDRIGR